ncbi:ABC transporter permease [Pyrobaculum neutrophilum]|uniref:ABC-2 type transporter n=1 Tax=Pyrobaculum neutrophilum (strain DSM 2338 / JCM 9278 / NBRC 100436 / V24Sta) TaxID=444157 RepID=B1YAV2_PYRNV|nr:ABC transporter permease [Pyrobaculum neutrophilum]ACB39181.1 ABC-2 type transporter [Pyrobaculum neutrophilum V24Sta]
MGVLTALVVKDLREILASRYFILSLVGGFAALVFMGLLMGASIRGAAAAQKFAVVANDTNELGRLYVEKLRELGGVVYGEFTPELLEKYSYVVVVPRNFTFPARLEVYRRYSGFPSLVAPAVLRTAAEELAKRAGVPPALVNVTLRLYFDGAWLGEAEAGALLSLYMVSFVATLMVPLLVAATAAIAVGVEKEKRTFELILATPATPSALVLSKLVSSILLMLIQFAVFLAGYGVYFANLANLPNFVGGAPPPELPRPGLHVSIPPGALALSALSILAMSIFVVAVSFALASRAEDIKTAQSVATTAVFFFAAPAVAVFFAPTDWLKLDPLLHPLYIALAALFGRWGEALLLLTADWALAAVALYIVSRIVTAEYLIAGRRRR